MVFSLTEIALKPNRLEVSGSTPLLADTHREFEARTGHCFLGRAKDLIISGGFNVYPEEIESQIDELPGIKESAVVGVPHPNFGEGIAVVVVPDGSDQVTEQSVVGALKDRLARFKQRKRVFIVDELPRNAIGKVQKNVLRNTYRDTFA